MLDAAPRRARREVIKLEPPEGDNMRHVGEMRHRGMGHIHLNLNRGKRSLVLDLKKPAAREAALRLAAQSDVLASNVRPAAMKRLGLSYEDVAARNPRIIYVSACGFSQKGPYADKPAYDDLIQGATAIPCSWNATASPSPASRRCSSPIASPACIPRSPYRRRSTRASARAKDSRSKCRCSSQ
jgi:crotonobetainyl-CoA:carnitine CoA-transferase CaiB-like acyl-CoA transferase